VLIQIAFLFGSLRGSFVFFVTLAGLPDRSKRQSHEGAGEHEVFARFYAALSLSPAYLTALVETSGCKSDNIILLDDLDLPNGNGFAVVSEP